MSLHKAIKSKISSWIPPRSSSCSGDGQEQLSARAAYHPSPGSSCIRPFPAATDSSQTKHSQRSTTHVAVQLPDQQQLKIMAQILHDLLDETQVQEKIKQILHGFMDSMARQVLVQNGTAMSAHPMEAEMRKLEGLLERKKGELCYNREKENMLQRELEEVRSKLCTSSSSQNDGLPSPAMLQDALYDVHRALMECASKLLSELTQAQPPPRLSCDQKRTTRSNCFLCFQHQLCTSFFTGFETLSFNGTQDVSMPATAAFEKPKDLKLRLFHEFNCYKTCDAVTLQHSKQVPFQAFMDSMRDHFLHAHIDSTAPFEKASDRLSFLHGMLDSERGPVYGLFLELGKAAWLLHKLAFALEPAAEIFKVRRNSNYDPEYMKTDQDLQIKSTSKVRFMAVPGFTFTHLVFKAHVYLK